MQTLHNLWRWYMSAFEANWWSTFFFSIPAAIIAFVVSITVIVLLHDFITELVDDIRRQLWDDVIWKLMGTLFIGGSILGIITLLP